MSTLPSFNQKDQITAVIDYGCVMEGKLCFQGVVRIGGVFRGEIYTPDCLIISEGAQVEGIIEAGRIVVSGMVRGTLKATQAIELYNSAQVTGDISAPALRIEEGAIFEGTTKMDEHWGQSIVTTTPLQIDC